MNHFANVDKMVREGREEMSTNTLDPERLPPFISPKQYAAIMGCSHGLVTKQLREGTLPGAKIGKKLWKISRETVAQKLQEIKGN